MLRRWSEVEAEEPEQLNKPLEEDGREFSRASTGTQMRLPQSRAAEGKLRRQEKARGQDDAYLKRPEWQKYQVLVRIRGWTKKKHHKQIERARRQQQMGNSH